MQESYSTKQKDLLLTFLSNNHDKLFTVSEIVDALKNNGISKSSIYRNLDTLLNNNLIRKVIVDESKIIKYQFITNQCKGVIHLCCHKCNKMIHLNDELNDIILKKYEFLIDKDKTVVYGLCKDCNQKFANNL